MKRLISAVLLMSALSPIANAGVCRGAQFVAGSSAAATMVAGYRGYRAFVRSSTIEKMNSVAIFSGRGSAEAAAHNIQADDKVTVSYNLSPEANRRHHIGVLESDADSKRFQASSYRSQGIAAMMPKTESYTDHQGNLQTRVVAGDHGQAFMFNSMADTAESEARGLDREAAEVRSGRGRVPVYTLEENFAKTNQVAVAAKLTDMSREGSRILTMTRLPRAAVLRVARASRNGWMLVATATALGLIAGEEALVGRISCRRQQELGNY